MKKQKIIKIPMPVRQYKAYKKIAHVKSEKAMSEAQTKSIFAQAVDGFLKGDISIDGLAMICNKLFQRLIKIKNRDPKFFDTIIAGLELSFYIRSPKLLSIFSGFLKSVLDYRENMQD